MKRLFRGFARSGDGSGRRSRAIDSRRALRTASSDTSPCSEATGRRGTARRNAEKPRSGVTSSTGWPSSVGHRRTLLVGDGPVSRVRCGPVPIHAPTPSGRVILPRHVPWLGEFLNELLAFPNSRHDDQVDSVTQFLGWQRGRQRRHRRISTVAPILVPMEG